MPADFRPVEDLIVAREEAQETCQRLLERLTARGRLGRTPTDLVICHLLAAGYTLEEIQADYGCSRWSLMWRLRQACR
jgi:AraC-like DNA-binding protein